MKKNIKIYIAGLLTGLILTAAPIFADSYTKAVEALVNFATIQINGVNVESDNFVVDGKTYVWIRDVVNMLDKDIIWNEDTNTANIVEKGSVANTVADINGRLVTDRRIRTFMNASLGTPKETVFDQLLNSALTLSYADSVGLSLDSSEVEMAIGNLDSKIAYYGQADYNEMLSQIGATEAEYIAIVLEDQLQEKLYNKMYDETEIADEQLTETYDSIKSAYTTVTAKHILISLTDLEGNPKAEGEAKKNADDIYSQLQKGADFDKLMLEYTDDPGITNNPDGYTFGHGEMVQAFEEAAFTQEINKLYEPVQTNFGYHIILVVERETPSFEELRETVFGMKFSEFYNNFIEELKNNAVITVNEELLGSI